MVTLSTSDADARTTVVTDPFEKLGAPRTFRLDLRAVEKTHRDLSRALHPDKYVSRGASERREALARAVEVNEAWRVVKDPIRRAEALFALAGVPIGETNEPRPGPELLMEMMEEREALDEARKDASKVKALTARIEARKADVEARLGAAFEEANGDRVKLAPSVTMLGELRYYRRFLEEASAILTDLEAAS